MTELCGPGNLILEVDLTRSSWRSFQVSDQDRMNFLGAKGLGLKLLFDRLGHHVDPLGPDNVMAVMPGVLMGTGGPCSGRFHALAVSPLTGIMTSSSCGGSFGRQLKTAGWDGLLLHGLAPSPTWIEVTSRGVAFHQAADLWGADIQESQEKLPRNGRGALVIGPAGENLVRFANVASDSRFLGRGGLGAVMGSKKLKAVVARGGAFKILPRDPDRFARARNRAQTYLLRNETTGRLYRRFGTNTNLNLNNAASILPVRNFQHGRHDQAFRLSGERIREVYETRHHTCKPCTILCGHLGRVGDAMLPVPEYETMALMGTNLGVFDPERIFEWNRLCNALGLDTISAGGTLAWLMEAGEQGLIETELCFGSPRGVGRTLTDIGLARGLGRELGQGTRRLAAAYGGRDFAMEVKGMEIPGYDPRGSVGQGLSYAVANRGGCHLSAFMVGPEVYFHLLDPQNPKAKARYVSFFEALTNCVNSLQTCQFTMFAYILEPPLSRLTPTPVLKALMQHLPWAAIPLIDFGLYRDLWSAVTGLPISRRAFLRAGHRIHVLERVMNLRQGLDPEEDTLPSRLLSDGSRSRSFGSALPLQLMLKQYYRIRGYDRQGRPTPRTLKKLGLEFT
jgi:aldehyde:ferredoxin oxidoreductase